jgi:hypothetical protein
LKLPCLGCNSREYRHSWCISRTKWDVIDEGGCWRSFKSCMYTQTWGEVVRYRLGKSLGSLYLKIAVVGLAMGGALIGFWMQKWLNQKWSKTIVVSWFCGFRTWWVQ